MTLSQAYRKHAVETHLILPLEEIWGDCAKTPEQRAAYIDRLASHLATEDAKILADLCRLIEQRHKLVRFPSIAHILEIRNKAERPGQTGGEYDIARLITMRAKGIHLSQSQLDALKRAGK